MLEDLCTLRILNLPSIRSLDYAIRDPTVALAWATYALRDIAKKTFEAIS